jgi:glycogen debranching enzyme
MHPRLVILVVNAAYQAAKARAFHEMATFVRTGDEFVKALALCSVQLFGGVESAGLHPFDWTGSLAAGLPHFSTHHMRCWGRDVFISMKGLLLATGRYKHAHNTILAFASTLKHGMIPNLLDSQRRPRYNARDSVWWFLQAVQDYCKTVTQGIDILHEKVKMRFDNDDYIEPNDPRAYVKVMTLEDIVQNTLQAHATGIAFREWNAGSNLDHAMQDEGFNVTAKLDPSTGFIHGGNAFNCGTWMDKMGESHQGGNYGVPSTPRDGAAIELVGMTQSTVEWLAQLHAKGKFKYGGVDVVVQGKKQHLSYNDWNKTLQVNFEKHFCVPTDGKEMYKDTVGSSGGFTDNQLRPNVCVAMVVAPELFNKTHAQRALRVIQQQLQGPLGMRTLDPQDPHYRGDYDAGADSNDRTVAKGANYHQGPEWLWCTGFFYQAYIKYCCTTDQDKEKLRQSMLTLREALHNSPWKGLPELTNANGKPCPSSCPTQAWSAATMLDVLHLLQD